MSFYYLKNTIERHNYLASKNLSQLHLDELAYIHLNTTSPLIKLNDCSVTSRLYGLHESLLTPASSNEKNTITLITVISLIKELSGLYRLKHQRSNHSFINFILSFTPLSMEQAKLLNTLAKCLQRNGSFANCKVEEDMALAIFKHRHTSMEVITPPNVTWDGRYPITSEEVYTQINVIEMQKLALNILDRVFQGLLRRKIIITPHSIEEFFHKYLDTR